MRKFILIAVCFFIFQTVAFVDPFCSKGSGVKSNDLPRAFLSKSESGITISGHGKSISLRAHDSTLEEVLEKVAQEKKVTLKFYCNDPSLGQERNRFHISASSVVGLLRQLLSEDHQFTLLNREGEPIENGIDIAAVNIYPKECSATGLPVRVFISEKDRPLLTKPPEEVSLEELRDVLKREGPVSRRRAAAFLGIKGDEKGITYAREALKDQNPGVMFAAANALKRLGQKYGSEKVADAIYERFREKPYAEFLPFAAELDKDKIWPIIDGLTDQSGEREKGIIVRSLILTNDARAIKYLSRISSGPVMENSKQAIYGIGKIGGPEAEIALMKLLREGDGQRQVWAVQAVHLLPSDGGFEERAEVEKMVKEERVSDAMLKALVEAYYLEPIEKLMKGPDLKPELKIRALKALAGGGTEKTVEAMSIGLNDKAPQVRAASVEAMRAVALEGTVPYLIQATKDEDAMVRNSAVRALSGFPGDDLVAEALGKAIDDPDENVRRGAMDSLYSLGRPSDAMAAILKDCEKSKDPYVANKATSTLRYWGLN